MPLKKKEVELLRRAFDLGYEKGYVHGMAKAEGKGKDKHIPSADDIFRKLIGDLYLEELEGKTVSVELPK